MWTTVGILGSEKVRKKTHLFRAPSMEAITMKWSNCALFAKNVSRPKKTCRDFCVTGKVVGGLVVGLPHVERNAHQRQWARWVSTAQPHTGGNIWWITGVWRLKAGWGVWRPSGGIRGQSSRCERVNMLSAQSPYFLIAIRATMMIICKKMYKVLFGKLFQSWVDSATPLLDRSQSQFDSYLRNSEILSIWSGISLSPSTVIIFQQFFYKQTVWSCIVIVVKSSKF